jgi:hypothetical protein
MHGTDGQRQQQGTGQHAADRARHADGQGQAAKRNAGKD